MNNPFEENNTGEDELELIASAVHGDRGALEKLVLRHQAWIYNIAFKMVMDHDDASDITQEILVKMITGLATFNPAMAQFRSRKIRIIGISVDSVESHKKFIEKHSLKDIVFLSDEKKEVVEKYDTEHWLLPVSKRVYIIVDASGKVIFRQDTGFSLLENQTATLIGEIDKHIR